MAGNLLGGSPAGFVNVQVGSGLLLSGGVLSTVAGTLGSLGISELTGDVTAGPGIGSQVATLASTGVTPGSYTYASLTVDAKGRITAASSGAPPTGTVTSVGLALPVSVFSISGSPVTTSGTLTGAFATQVANTLFAGPTTGADAVPAFRALVAADIPALPYGTGTVTSVALSAPAELSVSGSPVTTAGTLALAWANQAANLILAGPTTGVPGTPAFRAMVAADLPAIDAGTLTGTTLAAGVITSSLTTVGTIGAGTWQGTIVGVTFGGTGANLSATGGASQVLKQASAGAAVTVGQLANTDITGLGTMSVQNASAVAITGGTIAGLTGLAIRDTSAAFDVTIAATSNGALTAGRILTLDMSNVAHTLDFGTTANTITFPSAASYTLAGLSVAGTWSAAQTNMTLAGTTTLSGFTEGSILFAGASGVITQDNANLFWHNTDKRLGIGTTTPAGVIQVTLSVATAYSATTMATGPRLTFDNPDTTANNLARINFSTRDTGGSLRYGGAVSVVFTARAASNVTADMAFQVVNAGAAAERARLFSAGDMRQGTGSAIATTATDGFLLISTCAGPPTGVPTNAGAGQIPLAYDKTNNRIYAYNGAWRMVAVA